MTGIVDYNAGNIRSVERAVTALGIDFITSKNPKDLEKAERLIFPGVGDAQYAMAQLKKTGFDSFLRDFAASKRPLLGICLGSQIIFDWSEEGDTQCLGLIKGSVRHFSNVYKEQSITENFKIPQIGWNSIEFAKKADGTPVCPLVTDVPEHSDFYFVHSYIICPENWDVVAGWTDYGVKVPAIIQDGSVMAFQFHPEKSATHGLTMLKNFSKLGGASC